MLHGGTELNQVMRTCFSTRIFTAFFILPDLRSQFILLIFNFADLVLQIFDPVVLNFHENTSMCFLSDSILFSPYVRCTYWKPAEPCQNDNGYVPGIKKAPGGASRRCLYGYVIFSFHEFFHFRLWLFIFTSSGNGLQFLITPPSHLECSF